jgi:HEAT repeat protein
MQDDQGAWREALPVLASLKDPQAVPVLVQRLRSFTQRDEVRRVLKDWSPAPEKEVARLMHDQDPSIQGIVLELLAAYGTRDDVLVPQTLADLKSPQTRTRLLAAEWLSKREKPDETRRAEVLKALEEAQKDLNPAVRENAGRAVVRWAGPESVPTLLKVLEGEQGGWREALAALVRVKDEKSLPAIVSRLKSFGQRGEVQRALQEWGPTAEKEVAQLMHNPDGGTRAMANALLSTYRTKDEVLLEPTLAGLKSTNRETRLSALGWLGQRDKPIEAKKPEVARELNRLLQDLDPLTRSYALTALQKWATDETADAIDQVLGPRPLAGGDRGKLYEILSNLKTEKAAEVAASRLRHPLERGSAAQALKKMGAVAEKPLRDALRNTDANARREACHILGDIGTRESLGILAELAAKDLNRNVKTAAADAVKKIQDRNR